MTGVLEGMPKFQCARDFFLDLEGPYAVVRLTRQELVERVGRLGQVTNAAEYGFLSKIVGPDVHEGEVVECRRYQGGVELIRYVIPYHEPDLPPELPCRLIVKFNQTGELMSYTFDTNEHHPLEIEADLIDGDPDNPRKMHFPKHTARWEDILDFAWTVDKGGIGLIEVGADGPSVDGWHIKSEQVEDGVEESFEIGWMPTRNVMFRFATVVNSRKEFVDFLRRFLRGGLEAIQQGYDWRYQDVWSDYVADSEA